MKGPRQLHVGAGSTSAALLHDTNDGFIAVTLQNDTLLEAQTQPYQTPALIIRASGPVPSVVEVGEILAWMGSALRSSPYPEGIAYCRPTISCQQMPYGNPEFQAVISFYTRQEDGGRKATSNGQCWHNLFRNPLVVEGYRVPRRSSAEQGLQIPLGMMAALCETSHVNPFAGGVFIKGFSTILVPTRYHDDLIMWHLLFNSSGDRISYNEAVSLCATNVSTFDLHSARHILGWCSEMKLYAGT